MERFKISIGDWSEDGHSQYEQFVFESNKKVSELQQAYKDSCKLTGLQFNYNENYTGIEDLPSWGSWRHMLCEYEESSINEEAYEVLKNHIPNIDDYLSNSKYIGSFSLAKLVLEFVKLSLPDLECNEASFKNSELRNITAFNGWWNKNLNEQIGYGLFY